MLRIWGRWERDGHPIWGEWHEHRWGDREGSSRHLLEVAFRGSHGAPAIRRTGSPLERHRFGSRVPQAPPARVRLQLACFHAGAGVYPPYVSVNTGISLGPERQSYSTRHTGPRPPVSPLHTHSRHRFIGQDCSHDERALYFLFSLSLLSLSIVEFVINTHMRQFHCKPLGLDHSDRALRTCP